MALGRPIFSAVFWSFEDLFGPRGGSEPE